MAKKCWRTGYCFSLATPLAHAFVVFFAIFALYCNIFQTFHGKHYCLCNNFVAYCFSKKKKIIPS